MLKYVRVQDQRGNRPLDSEPVFEDCEDHRVTSQSST